MTGGKLLIVGAGGHAKVVADALLAGGESVLGFLVADASHSAGRVIGLPVWDEVRDLSYFDRSEVQLVLGIGCTSGGDKARAREAISARFKANGWKMAGVRHPSAVCSSSATIGPAVQLLARAVVQSDANVGDGVIVNTAAVVEHDCSVGAYCHISIGAILCGGVTVGDFSHIGAGAVVREGVNVGRGVTIGMGSIVVKSCGDGETHFGNPARRAERS